MGYRKEILFTITILLLLGLAFAARNVLLLIYVSALFAVMITPLVNRIAALHLGTWRPSRGLALMGIVLAGVVVMVLFFMVAVPPIFEDMQQLTADLPNKTGAVMQHIKQVPILNRVNPEVIQREATELAARTVRLIPGLAGGVLAFFSFLIMTAYFVLDGETAFRWILSMLPRQAEPRLHRTLLEAKDRMRRWLLGQLLLMLVLGSASALVYGLLGIRYFNVLAVFTGLANIVPIVGPVLSVVLACVVAAFDGWAKVAGVLIFYLVYQQIENAFLTPRIMKAAVGLPALSIIIALAIGGELAGLVGAVVAVPSATLIAVLMDEYLVKRKDKEAPAS
ncbi:MAG: AI-2E family transporter [Acidobacteria bacterium]|nr:AI-2E family transporter [Acidobacteriota bacterium]